MIFEYTVIARVSHWFLYEDQCAVRSSDCERNTTSANFKSDDDTCTMQRDKALEWDTENPAFT